MQKQLLLGVEAIAQGAIDSGISGVYAYPGTPSTEITEYIQNSEEAIARNVHRTWAANEKTAMESALGMSYAGKRALVCMKHVGMNVAADCFMNAAITGANGGLVITAADDPSMHSSQNEQDSRVYGKFALIPVLEPSNQQEAYEMTRYGFALSETVGSPVLLRITTRLAHSRSGVTPSGTLPENHMHLPENKRQFVLLPAIARKQYKLLLEKQADFVKASEQSPFNSYTDGEDKSLGIIACGITYNYLMEHFNGKCKYPVVKVSQYPLPRKMLKRLLRECKQILVLEEGYPVVEELLKGYPSGRHIAPGRRTESGLGCPGPGTSCNRRNTGPGNCSSPSPCPLQRMQPPGRLQSSERSDFHLWRRPRFLRYRLLHAGSTSSFSIHQQLR